MRSFFNKTKIYPPLLLLAIVFLLSPTSIIAQINPQINYQGKLTDTSGLAVPDGLYNMRFWLLESDVIATTSAQWAESLTGGNRVQVTNGLFSVMLGEVETLTDVDFNQTLYLGVEIGGTSTPAWDGEMSPRKILGAVPVAFYASTTDSFSGLATTSFLRSDEDDTATGLLTFSSGLLSTASSTITNLTTSIATTTTLVINNQSFTNLLGTGLENNGGVLTVATSSLADLNAVTLEGQAGSYYLARANHTGTQLASTISDFSTTARGLFSSSATGLTYTSGTGDFSLTAGYNIPLTASTTNWNSAYNTVTANSAAWNAAAASTTALTPSYLRGLFTNTATGLTYSNSTGLTSLTAGYNIPLTASTTEWANALASTHSAVTLAGENYLSINGSQQITAAAINLAGTNVTGTLPVTRGGTGITSFGTGVATALGINVGTAGSFVTNGGALGTPSSGTLTNATGLPISSGVSGLGTGVATFLATPSSANLAAAVTGETGTGNLVFSAAPTFTGNTTLANASTTNLTIATNAYLGTVRSGTWNGSAIDISSYTNLGVTATGLTLSGDNIALDGSYNIPLTASTTNWNSAYNTVTANSAAWNAAAASTTALTPSYLRGLFTNTATGLTYSNSTGLTSLTAGYNIPLTASTTEWANALASTHSAVTLAGENYLSINGSQQITAAAINLAGTNVTGTLPVTRGGTGITSFGTGVATALGINVGTAGSFVTNGGALGTPSSGTLTNATGLPISSGVSGLGTGVATFLATPSSANLAAAVTGETGTGNLVFSAAPTFTGNTTLANASTTNLTIATNAYLGTVRSGVWNGTDIDISDYTNLGVTATGLTLSGDNIALDGSYNIPLTASTTNWNSAYNTVTANSAAWNAAAASTTALTPSYLRGLFTNTATGLTYSNSTGLTSLTAGYTIPLTASTTEWANKISSQWTTTGSDIYYTAGNVGIGTTDPDARLQILNDLGGLGISGTNLGTSHQFVVQGGGDVGDTASIGFQMHPTAGNIGAAIVGIDVGSNNQGELAFFTGTGSSGLDEALRIDVDGNIGIGTTTPSAQLHIGSADNDTQAYTLRITDENTNNSLFHLRSQGTGNDAPQDMYVSGRVGVGTTTPETILDVVGGFNSWNGGRTNFIGGLNSGLTLTTSGEDNVLLGYQSGRDLTTADGNVLIGSGAGQTLVAGGQNIAIGHNAMGTANTSSGTNNNVAIGSSAGYDLAGGLRNVLLGSTVANDLTSGDNNIIIGYASASGGLTTGSDNILIGYSIDAPTSGTSNYLSIGNLIFGTGIDGTGTSISTGNIGIGTTTPDYRLTVAGDINSTGALRFNGNAGTAGMVLLSNGSSAPAWTATTSLGFNNHDSVTVTGENYLSLSGQQITANAIDLSGSNVTGTIASARVAGSYTGITGTGALNAGSITSGFGNIDIGASTLTTTGQTSLANASTTNLTVATNSYLGTVRSGTWNGSAIDISSYTNLGVTATGLTLSGDNIALDGSYNIPLTASTTNWNSAYNTVTANSASWDAAAASTTALTPSYLRGLFTNTATGLTYSNSTGLTSLTAGYNIPLTASTTEWANKISSQWTTGTGGDIYYSGGDVGIGVISPGDRLDVDGNINFANGSALKIGGTNVLTADVISQNITLGQGAGAALTSSAFNNTAIGYQSLFTATTSNSNTAVGHSSLYSNTDGYGNTANGASALRSNMTGYQNTANGNFSLYNNTTGSENTAIGYEALFGNITGSYNTAIGYLAGRYLFDGSSAASSTEYSLFLGYNTKALTATDTNSIVIGYNANSLGSNTVVLGNDSISTTALKGSVGIGTTTPNYLLTVAGDINSTGALRFNGNAGTAGMVLLSNGSSAPAWTATSSMGLSSAFTTSSQLSALLSDEVGTGPLVFASSSVLTSPTIFGNTTLWDSVSIGTSAFSEKLNIWGGNVSIGGEGQDYYLALQSDDLSDATAAYVWSEDNIGFAVGASAGTPQFVVRASNGGVGIGTSTPETLLSVTGTSTLQHVLPQGAFTGNVSNFSIGASNARWSEMWAETYNVGTSTWSIAATGPDRFGIFSGASQTGTEALSIISSNQYVGLGTTNPGARLEVVGDIISKGTEWTSRTSAADNSWTSVAYGNGVFVAVAASGSGNRVMTSPDGINWTTRTSANNYTWNSVTYGNGLFVAVSSDGSFLDYVMTSPDGITWTIRNASASNSWQSVTYGNGLFVAVAASGSGNRVMTSPDGITWTSRTSAANNGWKSVTYGNGKFVAIANSGTDLVMTSSDGTTWATSTSADETTNWTSVTYGNGLFVAVGYNGTNHVMTSPDGITWTGRDAAASNTWLSVTYGNGLFVATANSGTGNRVMTSPDGINWSSRTSVVDNNWNSVTYGNGMFVTISDNGSGNNVMTSGKTEITSKALSNFYQGGMNISGNVGIGTTAPARALHVQITTDAPPVRFQDSNGYCEINPTSTTWTCTSDKRLKENVKPLDSQSIMANLAQLRPVSFSWISDGTHGERFGLIAQEVEEIFPDLVSTDLSTGYKSVAYGGLTPYLISGLQEVALQASSSDATLAALLAHGTASLNSSSPFYNLSDGEEDTVWERLVSLVQNFVDGVLTIAGLKTDELCVGSVCVDEAMFLQMVEQSGAVPLPDGEEQSSEVEETEVVVTEEVGTTTPSLVEEETATSTDSLEETSEPEVLPTAEEGIETETTSELGPEVQPVVGPESVTEDAEDPETTPEPESPAEPESTPESLTEPVAP